MVDEIKSPAEGATSAPPAAPTEKKDVSEAVTRPMSDEELEWSSLKGTTQDRVRELINQRNEERRRAAELEAKVSKNIPPPPVYQPQVDVSEQEKKAVQTLREYGIVTKEDLQALQDQLTLENEYQRLEKTYDGSDGRPKFNRYETEKHMKLNGIYNPEKAYKDLFEEELFDWKVRGGGKKSAPSFTERPTSSSRAKDEPLSADSIAEKLRGPNGREWWEKNREKIIPLMGELSATE